MNTDKKTNLEQQDLRGLICIHRFFICGNHSWPYVYREKSGSLFG
jgi:hypothetical protein